MIGLDAERDAHVLLIARCVLHSPHELEESLQRSGPHRRHGGCGWEVHGRRHDREGTFATHKRLIKSGDGLRAVHQPAPEIAQAVQQLLKVRQ